MKPGFLEDKAEPGDVVRETNRYVLGLIPYEETTTYGQGVSRAPEAIVEASGHVELFDEVLEVDASRSGILTVRPPVTDLASVAHAARTLRQEHPDALLGFVGGEHSITPALIEGVARPDMGIVWIDAHADLRSEFHGRPDNHACAGWNSMRFGPIVQVGIRTLAEEEWTLLKKTDRVRAHRAWSRRARADILDLPRDVYLSVDFDGFTRRRAVSAGGRHRIVLHRRETGLQGHELPRLLHAGREAFEREAFPPQEPPRTPTRPLAEGQAHRRTSDAAQGALRARRFALTGARAERQFVTNASGR
jgi:arginase family enzyme